jgi:PAS domain S-box-containing protein
MEKTHKTLFEQEIIRTSDLYTKLNNEKLKDEIYKLYYYINQQEKDSKKKLKEKLKERVYEAHSIASKIYEDNKKTKSKDEIFRLIQSALGSIIYNKGRGYFFIDDIDGVNLLQPLNRNIENQNLSELKDVNGYKFKQTIMQTIKDKTERFDTYYWYKSDSDQNAYKKMSFYKYFKPFNIAIGTGEYIDEFEIEIKTKVIEYIQKFNENNDGYIFMFNNEGILLAHKRAELIGLNFLNKGKESNKIFVKEVLEIGKSGEGFLSYFNPSDEFAKYKKTSFLKSYEKWNWIFGTGYNNGNLLKITEKAKKDLEIKNKENFISILTISIPITLLLLILSIVLSNYLENIFSRYKRRILEEERGFRNLFEYSNIGLAICDDKGKFIKVNSKFTQMLGYKRNNELLNKSWHSITENSISINEDKNFSDLVNQRINTYSIEKPYKKEDGTVIDTFITANLMKQNKEVKSILFSIIDVTELKTKDKVLFQQAKLASMGEMIANIAHQWRQPLSLISTASSGMKIQKEFNLLTDDNFNSSLDSITDTTKYLSKTIDNFKNFFSPRSDKEIINIGEITEKTIALVASELKKKNIQIIKDIKDIEIMSYENDLIQVFINIINNAKDAFLNLKDNYIFIDAKIEKNSNCVIINIKDNAGGIDEEVKGKIFEPYFTTKYKSNGTGIGLYMVMEIIQKHMCGSISVKNIMYNYNKEKYKGAQFTIRIPLK